MHIMPFLMQLIRHTEKQNQTKSRESWKQLFHGENGGIHGFRRRNW